MTLRITCIGRSGAVAENPLLSLTHFHWLEDGTELSGMFTSEEMFLFLKNGGDAYVWDKFWKKHSLKPGMTAVGERFIFTGGLNFLEDELLKQPLCANE